MATKSDPLKRLKTLSKEAADMISKEISCHVRRAQYNGPTIASTYDPSKIELSDLDKVVANRVNRYHTINWSELFEDGYNTTTADLSTLMIARCYLAFLASKYSLTRGRFQIPYGVVIYDESMGKIDLPKDDIDDCLPRCVVHYYTTGKTIADRTHNIDIYVLTAASYRIKTSKDAWMKLATDRPYGYLPRDPSSQYKLVYRRIRFGVSSDTNIPNWFSQFAPGDEINIVENDQSRKLEAFFSANKMDLPIYSSGAFSNANSDRTDTTTKLYLIHLKRNEKGSGVAQKGFKDGVHFGTLRAVKLLFTEGHLELEKYKTTTTFKLNQSIGYLDKKKSGNSIAAPDVYYELKDKADQTLAKAIETESKTLIDSLQAEKEKADAEVKKKVGKEAIQEKAETNTSAKKKVDEEEKVMEKEKKKAAEEKAEEQKKVEDEAKKKKAVEDGALKKKADEEKKKADEDAKKKKASEEKAAEEKKKADEETKKKKAAEDQAKQEADNRQAVENSEGAKCARFVWLLTQLDDIIGVAIPYRTAAEEIIERAQDGYKFMTETNINIFKQQDEKLRRLNGAIDTISNVFSHNLDGHVMIGPDTDNAIDSLLGKEDQICFNLEADLHSNLATVQQLDTERSSILFNRDIALPLTDALKSAVPEVKYSARDMCALLPDHRSKLAAVSFDTTPLVDVPLAWRIDIFRSLLTHLPTWNLLESRMAERQRWSMTPKNVIKLNQEKVIWKLWTLCMAIDPTFFNDQSFYKLLFWAWDAANKDYSTALSKTKLTPDEIRSTFTRQKFFLDANDPRAATLGSAPSQETTIVAFIQSFK